MDAQDKGIWQKDQPTQRGHSGPGSERVSHGFLAERNRQKTKATWVFPDSLPTLGRSNNPVQKEYVLLDHDWQQDKPIEKLFKLAGGGAEVVMVTLESSGEVTLDSEFISSNDAVSLLYQGRKLTEHCSPIISGLRKRIVFIPSLRRKKKNAFQSSKFCKNMKRMDLNLFFCFWLGEMRWESQYINKPFSWPQNFPAEYWFQYVLWYLGKSTFPGLSL